MYSIFINKVGYIRKKEAHKSRHIRADSWLFTAMRKKPFFVPHYSSLATFLRIKGEVFLVRMW